MVLQHTSHAKSNTGRWSPEMLLNVSEKNSIVYSHQKETYFVEDNSNYLVD
jgi:hypothetical protein